MNKKILNSDITIKIISVIFAVLLWFYVITEQNPIVAKAVTIPVQLTNASYLKMNNLELMSSSDSYKITIDFKGKKNILDTISDAVITASADLSSIRTEGENNIAIIVNGIPKDVDWYRLSAEQIKVYVEPRISQQLPVQIKVTGQPALGLAAMKAVSDPADIVISGPASYVRRVDSVRVDVDVTGESSDVNRNLSIKLLDKSGTEITNVDTDQKRVNVLVPITNTKIVPVQYNIVGTPAEGYIVKNIYMYPKEVTIVGKIDDLNNINSISTEKLDISGFTESFDSDIGLILPLNVELAGKTDKTRLNVEIEPIVTKTIEINSIEVRNLSQDYVYTPIDNTVEVTVKGASSVVDQAAEIVKLYVDMRHATEGINNAELLWEKDSDIEVLSVSVQNISVEVKKKEAASE